MDALLSAMRGLAACMRAMEACQQAICRFQSACIAGDWAAAEAARVEVVASLECHLDEFMSAQRAAQGIIGDGGDR